MARMARMTDATDVGETPFPLDLWSEAVYSRRSIPDTLATGEYAPDEPSTDSSSGTPPAGPRFALAPPPLRLEPAARASRGLADPSVLAALLHYSFGLFQHDLTPGGWPLHRAVASARCLYPSELYLLSPDADDRPADVYRFDPLHHQLALVRAAVDGRYPDPSTETGASRFLVITSRFARTARLYGGYAPRLCAQEAGMLLGAVHLVAAALGLRTRTGLDHETLLELSDGWPESGAEHPMAYLEVSPAAEHHNWVPADTAGALRARHSGAALFDPEPAAAPKAMLDELCTVLAHAPFADFSCHLYLSRVTDLPSGRYLLAGGRLRLVQAGDVVPELEQIGQTEGRLSMNFRAVSFTAYLAVSRGAAVATYGADAFRRLHLVAGAAAHLLSVVAARHGQSARVHNGYEAATAERLLGLTGSGETVLFQIAVGAAKPAPGFRLPVVF
jgi:SagB-type dehydrogenase family enzyme